jgi:hypothetical protein
MSEMVERVARAMFEDDQFDYEPKMPTWEETGAREEYRRKAKIAIRAMREPSEAMIDAAYTGYDSEGFGIGRHDALTVWQAMIDATLPDAGVTISERPSDETMR